MRLAFAIVRLFPGGGLQRDCVALAQEAQRRGHDVTVFTSRLVGAPPADLTVTELPNAAFTNHGRNQRFATDFAAAARGFDRRVGFDKLPGLDVLYCADPCFIGRPGALRRLTPRYRVFAALEKQCFGRGQPMRLILLSPVQRDGYRRAYDTEPDRITLLSPTVNIKRRRPELRRDGTREKMRASVGVAPATWLWLAVGAQAKTKGFDRVIEALPAFPQAHLLIVGIEASTAEGAALLRLSVKHGCAERVRVVGFHEDVPQLMATADLLVHPARLDTTGTVILEAIVNGLPVVATAVCGYAEHISKADAGIVVVEPFRAEGFQSALAAANDRARAERWSANAVQYGQNPSLYSGLSEAANIILADKIT